MQTLKQASLAFAIFYAIYYIYWQLTTGARRRALIKEKGCQAVLQYPYKEPFFAIDLFIKTLRAVRSRTLLELTTQRFYDLNARTIKFKLLGRPVISTIEPENLKTIQALNFKQWSLGKGRKKFFNPFLGVGIFTSDGADWAHSREMLRPNFARTQVGDLDTYDEHISHFINAVPTDGSIVDLQDLFFRLTIDSATEFLFGESTNTLAQGTSGQESNASFADAFNHGQEFVVQTSRYGVFAPLLSRKQFNKDAKFVQDFIDRYVEKGLAKRDALLAEKDEGRRYIFIEELVRQTTDRVRIRDELLHILLAGRDTTASLLSNVWWVLSKRPDVWAALRAEVGTLSNARPSYEQLKNMKYLKAVLNETLRLYPVVPLNSREAVVDTVLPLGGGRDGKSPVFIPKGQLVTWNLYAMHRRKDYYGEDAEEFRPERWLGAKGLRPGWEYLPFNGGPRICLGQQFALTEASYTTVRLVQAFAGIESRDPEPWREWLTLTCVGLGGCKVVLTPA